MNNFKYLDVVLNIENDWFHKIDIWLNNAENHIYYVLKYLCSRLLSRRNNTARIDI